MPKVEYPEITNCHRHLHRILSECGFQVRDNVEQGKYRVDCMMELENMGFEANGKLWHWHKRDKKRDDELLKNYGISIIRISEKILDGKHDDEVKDIILRSIDLCQ